MIKFSIILPIYKQQGFLLKIFEEYANSLKKIKDSYEVILAINGPLNGYDNELKEIKKYKGFVAYKINGAGWGLAVNYGISKAKGEFICFTNSANTNPSDVVRIFKKAIENPEAVIKAKRVKREEDWFRILGSLLYSFENRVLFGTPIRDINAFPTVFHRKYLKSVKVYANDSLWDAEFLAKCYRQNIPIKFLSVSTSRQFNKKSNTNLKTAWKLYTGIIALKLKIKD